MTKNARTCYLHIGMHKTGSSSIQETLFAVGKTERLYYAQIGGVANHGGPLINAFSRTAATYHANVKRGLSAAAVAKQRERYRAELLATMRAQPGMDMVISGEGISLLEDAELVDLHRLLGEEFDVVQVIGYVRTPKSYMESSFQQMVKGVAVQLKPQALYPGYRGRFEKFDRVFGREQVVLKKFDPASFPDGCVVTDFCRTIGWTIAREQIVRTNESLSRTAVALLFAYRKFGPGYGVGPGIMFENNRLVEALATLSGPKLRFAPALVSETLHRQRADICWMEERLGMELDESTAVVTTDIDSEESLLHIEPEAVAKLLELIEPERRPSGEAGSSPQHVAQLVHILRLQLNARQPVRAGSAGEADNAEAVLGVRSLLASLNRQNPLLLSGISDGQAVMLLQELFAVLGRELAGAEDGIVVLAGLGRFRVQQVCREGEEAARRVIHFIPTPLAVRQPESTCAR